MNKAEREENSRIAALGCLVCGNPEAQIHHWREGNERRATAPKIGLCVRHHMGKYGEGFHSGKKMWIATFGTREHFIALRDRLLQEDK